MVNSLNWLIFALAATILLIVPDLMLFDADTGWHIMAGHDILKNRAIPETNVFSFTATDYRWYNISWLSDVIFAGLDKTGGLYAVAAFTALICSLTQGLLAWLFQKRGAGVIATATILALGILAYASHVLVRPHIFTNLLIVIFLAIILYGSRKQLFILPLLMLLWANLHGGFLIGFTILGAYILQHLAKKNYAKFRTLSLVTALCVVTIFINPLGFGIIDAALSSLNSELKDIINEWKPPLEPEQLVFILGFTFIFFRSFKHLTLADKILCAFWIFMGYDSQRNLPVLMLICSPALAYGLQQLISTKPSLMAKDGDYKSFLSKPTTRKGTIAIAVVLPLLLIFTNLIPFNPSKSINYAEEEVGYILATRPEARIFNHYDIGGYIIYQSEGKLKTFIDGRADTAFPRELLSEYKQFHFNKPEWPMLLDKYQIDTVIIPPQYSQGQMVYLDANWRKVYEGSKAVVYFRN